MHPVKEERIRIHASLASEEVTKKGMGRVGKSSETIGPIYLRRKVSLLSIKVFPWVCESRARRYANMSGAQEDYA